MAETNPTAGELGSISAGMAAARKAGIDRLDTQLLLAAVTGQSRSWLVAHDDAALSADQAARLADWIARRAQGEPLAYLLGEKEFHGLKLHVSPAVLIPRADTETLVDWALYLLGDGQLSNPIAQVLDMGTGSGAIALAIKHRRPEAEVTALDASPQALAIAQQNGQDLRLSVQWLLSDWWQSVADRRFDLIVSNPPYIAGDDAHLPALCHEPLLALTPGGDGLDALRAIVAGASTHLQTGGWLLLEHGYDQAEAVTELLRAAQFTQISTRNDLAGHARCTGGQWA